MKVVKTDGLFIARSVNLFVINFIETGVYFDHLDNAQKKAILAHEEGHIVHHHFWQRLWWLFTCDLFDLPTSREKLMQKCREQEFEADDYADAKGYGIPLLTFLVNCRHDDEIEDGFNFHPTPQARINRLIRRRNYGE